MRDAVSGQPLLVRVLREPAAMAGLSLSEWDLLLRQAEAASLGASLSGLAAAHALLDRLPTQPREHLEWARVRAARHRPAVHHEVAEIRKALVDLGLPLVLLKGAAYVLADLPAGAGRLFNDVDILVPKARLGEVEAALMLAGWATSGLDAYDERYYRQWMHELPPMQHMRRESAIDVHHAILPETARLRPDPAQLLARAVPVGADPTLRVLAPADMVLHSAIHLFGGGEFDKGLRDLFDIHRLLLHFGATPGFWEQLPPRARELELERPLFYALRYAARVLGTPVPAAVRDALAGAGPQPLLLAVMDGLFLRALMPAHASCADRFSAAARFLLYVRGNWLRMPPVLLARHLFHKAFISERGDAAA